MSLFKKATRESGYLRLVFHGSPGAGKTFGLLKVAHYLEKLHGYPIGTSIALIDTERGSASKYAGEVYDDDGSKFDFLTLGDEFFGGDYSMKKFNTAIAEVQKEKIPILIIDSLTHFWNSSGGIMEYVDAETSKSKSGNSYVSWKKGDLLYKQMVQIIASHKGHILISLRSKMGYETKVNDFGKKELQRIGLQPEMRDHLISELDVEGIVDEEHMTRIGKTRCSTVDGKLYAKVGLELAKDLYNWNTSGVKGKDVFAEIKKDSEKVVTSEELTDFADKIKNNKILMTELEIDELRAIYNTLLSKIEKTTEITPAVAAVTPPETSIPTNRQAYSKVGK